MFHSEWNDLMILLSHSYLWTVITVMGALSLSPYSPVKQKGNLLSYIWGSSEAKQASALGDLAGQRCHQGPFFCSAFLTGLVPLFRLLDGAIPALHSEIAMP